MQLPSLVRQVLAARRTAEPQYPDQSRIGFTGKTLAGVTITPDNAITVPAVWACLRYLSQSVGVPPWRAMREDRGGSKVARSHPVDWLLHKRPNPEWSAMQFRETLVHWALRWGNGYAEIERNTIGTPLGLWPLHPSRVRPVRDRETRLLVYEVQNDSGQWVDVPAADMFHIRGFGDGPIGVNVMEYAAESIGWAKAAQLFGAAFFGNGMNVAGVVESKAALSPPALKILEAKLAKLYAGVRKAFKWVVLDAGMQWKAIGVDPEKGQMIPTNQFLVEEICRWFGVPPHKVMHLLRATFTNIEHQSVEVVTDSILPWVKRFEEEADYKLFGQNRPGYFTKINLRGLLRGDFKTQQEGFQVMRISGVINADEWRELIDMGPMPAGAGGDKYVMQSNNTTLERIGEEPDDDGAEDMPFETAKALGRLRGLRHAA